MRLFRSKKRIAGMVSTGIATGLALSAIAYATVSFGPSRPTFTWAHPANYVTFNSITDNPNWGDERQLLKTRDVNSPTSAYSTQTQVTDNETVVMTIHFHNNAAASLNLVATNTRARFALPSTSATTVTPTAYISADNANPGEVWSTADLTGSRPFTLEYIPGSAKLFTNKVNGTQISDNVVTSGTAIGTNGTDGRVPGCSEFSGYVTIRAKVHMPTPTPTPSPTPTPTTIPNTGAGEVAGLFAGASAIGAAGHYVVARRNRR
jgi:hypothetical protein